MAYPSNDNKGAKNLVDFVVHLRDAEDAFGDVVNKAKEDITELINAVQGIDDTSTSKTGVWSSEKVSTEVAASNAAALAAHNAADAAQASANAAQTRADKGVADAATAKGVADKAASDLAAEVSRAVAAERAASNAASTAQQTADSKAPISHATSETTYGSGSSSLYGHVKLSDNTASTSSVSSGVAATPKAVKAVKDAVDAETARAEAAEAALNGDISANDAALRALIAEEVAKYLPLAGGTMTGGIISTLPTLIRRNNNNDSLSFNGGTSWNDGATLELIGSGRSNGPGNFLLRAKSASASSDLIGYPNGTLIWKDKSIEGVDSNGDSWIRYSNGLQFCWGSVNISSGNINTTVTLPKSFKDSSYLVGVTNPNVKNSDTISCAGNKTASTIQVSRMNLDKLYSFSLSVDWFAFGYWK